MLVSLICRACALTNRLWPRLRLCPYSLEGCAVPKVPNLALVWQFATFAVAYPADKVIHWLIWATICRSLLWSPILLIQRAVFPHPIPSLLTHTSHSVVLGPYQAYGQFARCIGKPGALSLRCCRVKLTTVAHSALIASFLLAARPFLRVILKFVYAPSPCNVISST